MVIPSKDASILMAVGATMVAALQCMNALIEFNRTLIIDSSILSLIFASVARWLYVGSWKRLSSIEIASESVGIFIVINILLNDIAIQHNFLWLVQEGQNLEFFLASVLLIWGILHMISDQVSEFHDDIDD